MTVVDPVFTHHESAPINARGDRVLLRGEPGPCERVTRIMEYRARVQAEERILTYLERIPGLLEQITREQADSLRLLCLSLIRQAVSEDRERMVLVLQGAGRLLPGDQCVPDPRDDAWRQWLLAAPAERDLLETEAEVENGAGDHRESAGVGSCGRGGDRHGGDVLEAPA